jgi:hypothetical protein
MNIATPNSPPKWLYLAVLALPLLTGCGSAKEASKGNFEKAINAKLEKQCIDLQVRTAFTSSSHEFPLSVATVQTGRGMSAERAAESNAQSLGPLDALAKVGLVTASDGQVKELGWGGNKEVPGKIYSLTDAGAKALRDRKSTVFCAGRYQVAEVVSFTEPGNAMGVTISRVKYTVKAVDVPAWANDEAIKSAFPQIQQHIEDKTERNATLVLQNDGWSAETGGF